MAAGTALPAGVWAASLLVGTTVASVLFCSHWHQIEGDRAAGKMSPLVRLGPDRALQARTRRGPALMGPAFMGPALMDPAGTGPVLMSHFFDGACLIGQLPKASPIGLHALGCALPHPESTLSLRICSGSIDLPILCSESILRDDQH